MKQKNIWVVVIIVFLLGFIVGAGALRYVFLYRDFPAIKKIHWLNFDECPGGMREHFDEGSGRFNCVPEDYIGI